MKGKHEMNVRLLYGDDNVRIEYEDSKQLEYKKDWFGNESIHKNYNVWVAELRWEIIQKRSYQ